VESWAGFIEVRNQRFLCAGALDRNLQVKKKEKIAGVLDKNYEVSESKVFVYGKLGMPSS